MLRITVVPLGRALGQTWVLTSPRLARVNAEATIPVGTAMIVKPISMITAAMDCPRAVCGEMSP